MRPQGPWRRRTTLVAVAASAVAHVAILALVLATFASRSPAPEPPPIFVDLAPRLAPAKRTARPQTTIAASAHVGAPTQTATPSPLPPAPDGAPQRAPADAQIAAQEGLGKALRQSVRCAHPDDFAMDPAERAWCQKTARGRAAGAPTYAAIPSNPSTAAALEHERRVSEAWRSYHSSYRTDGPPGLAVDHPGLASMFGGADPCPPGPACWHPIGH